MGVIIFTIIIVIILIGSGPLMKFIERHKLKFVQNIEQNGIETEAIVTKVTSTYDSDIRQRRYITYVKFIGDDNNEREGRLLNVPLLSSDFQSEEKLRVSFLPGEYDLVFFISKEI